MGVATGKVAIVAWMCGTVVVIKGGIGRHNDAQKQAVEVRRYLKARFNVDKVWIANDWSEDETWQKYLWLRTAMEKKFTGAIGAYKP